MQSVAMSQLVLKKHWAHKASSVLEGLAQLKAQLSTFEKMPEQLIFVSAGEVKPLINPDIAAFCHAIADDFIGDIDFISAACTSLHAAVLHFNRLKADSCLILLLDLDEPIQQGCLDSLGVGINDNSVSSHNTPNGLIVNNSVGYCLLSKLPPKARELVISQCHIMSQDTGISGMGLLLKQLAVFLKTQPDNSKVVAFDIRSTWSNKLKLALKQRLNQTAHTISWLESAETDNNHYLSVKPLFEIQNYQEQLTHNNLSLLTLGGGGRLGYLTVTRTPQGASNIAMGSFDNGNLKQDTAQFKQSIDVSRYSMAGYHAIVKANLKYPQLQYRGINNHYFRWPYRQLTQAGIKK